MSRQGSHLPEPLFMMWVQDDILISFNGDKCCEATVEMSGVAVWSRLYPEFGEGRHLEARAQARVDFANCLGAALLMPGSFV